MKTAKVGSKKILKAAQPRRVAGVRVRSGVKAGRHPGEFGAGHEFGSHGRGGELGRGGFHI